MSFEKPNTPLDISLFSHFSCILALVNVTFNYSLISRYSCIFVGADITFIHSFIISHTLNSNYLIYKPTHIEVVDLGLESYVPPFEFRRLFYSRLILLTHALKYDGFGSGFDPFFKKIKARSRPKPKACTCWALLFRATWNGT